MNSGRLLTDLVKRVERGALQADPKYITEPPVELKEGEAPGKDRRIGGLAFCTACCGAWVVIGNFEKSVSVRFSVAIGG